MELKATNTFKGHLISYPPRYVSQRNIYPEKKKVKLLETLSILLDYLQYQFCGKFWTTDFLFKSQ
jgi:hypothetical protein